MPGIDTAIQSVSPAAQGAAAAVKPAKSASFSFDDLLDVINPLQHIPVISTIYRHLTGDTIGLPEKIAGDGLYGGFTGLACSVGDALFQEITGKNVGDTVYDYVFGDGSPKTGVATGPIAVTPASSLSISMPDLSGMFTDAEEEASGPPALLSPLALRATSAYRQAMDRSTYSSSL